MIKWFSQRLTLPFDTFDRINHPKFYPESSDAANENLEQTFHGEPSTEGEEEHLPLPIWGAPLTQESAGPSLNKQLIKNKNYELERHLGKHLETEIEEVFRERTTPELQ